MARRIECMECGATDHLDPDEKVASFKLWHRMHHCPNADFEVEA